VIRGVIFDLDGVLADTEPLHWAAYREVLLEFGVDVGVEEYRLHFIAQGRGPEHVCRTYGLALSPDEVRRRKAPRYEALLRAGVTARAGARAALERLRPRYRLAVATNASRDEADFVLGRLGLRALLDAVVAREDYRESKPAADAYLAAGAALGLDPADCVVVEDTHRGARAGLAAGMRVIALPNELTLDNDFTGCASRVTHLDELTPALLSTL
jgi:HAD superfamily hydrolase (TIGR01509 family)